MRDISDDRARGAEQTFSGISGAEADRYNRVLTQALDLNNEDPYNFKGTGGSRFDVARDAVRNLFRIRAEDNELIENPGDRARADQENTFFLIDALKDIEDSERFSANMVAEKNQQALQDAADQISTTIERERDNQAQGLEARAAVLRAAGYGTQVDEILGDAEFDINQNIAGVQSGAEARFGDPQSPHYIADPERRRRRITDYTSVSIASARSSLPTVAGPLIDALFEVYRQQGGIPGGNDGRQQPIINNFYIEGTVISETDLLEIVQQGSDRGVIQLGAN